MEHTIAVLNLIWLFITVNSFLVGASCSLIFTFIIALKGEQWLERLFEKHPWWLEEKDFSIKAIIQRHREKKA